MRVLRAGTEVSPPGRTSCSPRSVGEFYVFQSIARRSIFECLQDVCLVGVDRKDDDTGVGGELAARRVISMPLKPGISTSRSG